MSNRYRDASLSPEERTEDLLAQMTLDEKLAQLQCHFYAHGDLQKETRYGIGQVSTLNAAYFVGACLTVVSALFFNIKVGPHFERNKLR